MSLRWQQIRANAAGIRTEYGLTSGNLVPALLPLEDLAARRFALSVFDDPTLGPNSDGELNPQVGSIRLRPGMHETRRRFVIAHELGHVVLERGVLALFEDNETTVDESAGGALDGEAGVLRAYNTRERAEREANLFALELLVPVDLLRERLLQPGWSLVELAQQFGVSLDAIRAQIVNLCCVEPPVERPQLTPAPPAFAPDPYQQAAVDAPLPTLVVAGPGTGKTRAIVAKYLSLVDGGRQTGLLSTVHRPPSMVDPSNILALTFSNKAAEEMRDRIAAALAIARPELAARVDVSTFHAWGLNLLRQFGSHLDLPINARLRSSADLYVLLRRRLADLPLHEYKNVREPGMFLRQIIGAISRAKDHLVTPDVFRRHAEAEAMRLIAETEATHGGKSTKTAQREIERARRNAARLRELAAIYERYQELLREEGALDYGDLIALTVDALRIPAIAEAVRQQHQYILVDEFQDINDASGELLRLLDGGRGRVWAVGDPWQSIYRFRGASPANLAQFAHDYPGAVERDLRLNYRSLQPILDASHTIMTPDLLYAERPGLLAHRRGTGGRVVEWVCADAEAEAAAIAEDIVRRTGTKRVLPTGTYRKVIHATLVHPRVLATQKRYRLGDHAILCRTHAQADTIAAALRACEIPVDLVGELLDDPDVKDALAVFGFGANEDVATLRALTIPGHALDDEAITLLVRHTAAAEQPLAQAVRDPAVLSQLDATNHKQLQGLLDLAERLAGDKNAWHALVHYTFERGEAQAHVAAALEGSQVAQRSLVALGELIQLARGFVREAPEGARSSADFLAHIRLLSEGGERIAIGVPPNEPNVVRVMTVHAAKGLEFPVVYIPGVQKGVFPARRQYGSIPALPALSNESDDPLAEERYLLYVAMTRARDQLILSRAATRRAKAVRRSPLIPGDEHGVGAPWHVLQRNVRVRSTPQQIGERLHTPTLKLVPLSASMLETYELCPRQCFYRDGFGLAGESGTYSRMHHAIRALAVELTQQAEAGALPIESTLETRVSQILAEHKLSSALYAEDYAAETLAQTRQLWHDLQTQAKLQDVDRHYTVKLPSGDINVAVDRVEAGETGPRFVRDRTGLPRDNDHLTTRVALYGLAQQQTHGKGEVALRYTTTGDQRTVPHKPAALDERAAALDALLQRIAANDWTPNFGPQCSACPFVLICPV